MAVSFVARKCTQCAGKLQYIKEKKIWKCLYCGAEIERQEQYDGLFTIKNVVRQSLLDTAYRRLDSAYRNLLECEKIDSRYVGTIIAKLAYDIIRVSTPGACEQRDLKAAFMQIKKGYEQLKETGTGVSEDEEALYEFLEEQDIFATLILVYDSLNDRTRRDFLVQQLEPKEVLSKPANNNLLTYAIKNSNIILADSVLANTDNLDPKTALLDVLFKYPDGEAKGDWIATILATGVIKYEDRKLIEKYLIDTADGVRTRGKACVAAMGNGLPISSDILFGRVLNGADPETVKETLTAFCKTKISDDDITKILSFAFDYPHLQTSCNAMDCLKNGGQFVLVPPSLLIRMLSNGVHSADDKLALLNKSFEFKVEAKSFDSVLNNYLCFNNDKAEDRKRILDALLEHTSVIPTSMVERYVLKCEADGENKPAIVSMIFERGLNISFFKDLLPKYMAERTDTEAVKTEVIRVLLQKGLKMDPSSLIEYICGSSDEPSTKIQVVKKMAAAGSQIRADAANAYLERTTDDRFSSELFSLVYTPGSTFSVQAAENYLLRLRDRDAVKADNAIMILNNTRGDFVNTKVQVQHLENNISCNLLQAYSLTTTDDQTTAMKIVDYLMSTKKMKINAEMSVSGSNMKLKKYAVANKARLSATTAAIFDRHKVYSILF